MRNTILLLDDDDLFRKMVIPGLSGKGFDVIEAGTGKEALDLFRGNEFCLLIVDGVLPDTDGIKWITRYRASGGTVPIIFISAHWQTMEIYQVLTRDLAVSQVIHKPVIPTVFAEQVYAEISRPQWKPSAEPGPSLQETISDSMQEMTREYLQDLPLELERISASIKAARGSKSPAMTLRQVLLHCHKLRGTAGSFGLHSLGEVMGRIEDCIKLNEDRLDQLEAAFWEDLEQNMIKSRQLAGAQESLASAYFARQILTRNTLNRAASNRATGQREISDREPANREPADRGKTSATDTSGSNPSATETSGSNPSATETSGSNLSATETSGAGLQSRTISRILVVDKDKEFLATVEKAARQRMVEVLCASTAEEVVTIITHVMVDAVLVDLKMAERKSFELARTIRELTAEQMPIAFISDESSLDDRLLAAHMGASLYLSKPIDPDTLEDAIQRLMILRSHEHPRVLIVDDDKYFAKRVSNVLIEKGMETQILTDPWLILKKMQSFVPEVLILDAIMPFISGFDICKMLRTIPRWQELPILFVSAQAGLQNRIAAFACGADDYLPKPVIDEELVTRVSLRVERARFLKERVEKDPVTGLLLRRSFMERFNAILAGAKRAFRPISLIIFDLDKFKNINDRHGHLAGDAVLAGLGRLMLKRFRVEDLRGRWGGDEFILALVGSDKEQSLRLMKNFLDEYAQLEFIAEDGAAFQASLSAGVATYPADGDQTYELLKVADTRLYTAKEQGRNCVVAESAPAWQAVEIEGTETRA